MKIEMKKIGCETENINDILQKYDKQAETFPGQEVLKLTLVHERDRPKRAPKTPQRCNPSLT